MAELQSIMDRMSQMEAAAKGCPHRGSASATGSGAVDGAPSRTADHHDGGGHALEATQRGGERDGKGVSQ